MQCDFCSNEATIEMVMIVDGQAQKVRMCPSCYKKKIEEMVEQLPKEWGGSLLAEQLKAVFEQLDSDGRLVGGLEMRITREVGEHGEMMNVEKMERRGTAESARERAFEEQLRSLKRQRVEATRAMEQALAEEDYEACAKYRDRIAEIGEELIRLNEERKDPYGV
ncbi:MAG: UvrB/UvrC motif-containing protein [Ndongobacter sp.]|nr:UvrB/UvrC motif-containing protein [Ndongobacter sp.]